MNTLKNLKKRKGFSLIELIVVILIIAVLALAVFAGGSAAIKKSQISRTTSDLHNFSIAIEAALNETPSVANIEKNTDFDASILKAINSNLSADYQLKPALTYNAATDGTNLVWAQAADWTDGDATAATAYKIYVSDKTDAWGNPYYVVLDATERHDNGISEFYVTVISAGPNAQTTIGTAVAKASVTTTSKGIEADDLFLLVQYTDGDVAAVTYNCEVNTLLNGAADAADHPLVKTTKGAVIAGSDQGFYIGTVLNGDGRATLCPVNFQPAA